MALDARRLEAIAEGGRECRFRLDTKPWHMLTFRGWIRKSQDIGETSLGSSVENQQRAMFSKLSERKLSGNKE